MGEMILELKEPEYMQAFVCREGSCTDTCCAGWDIVFDAAACRRYAADGRMQKRFAARVMRNTEQLPNGEIPFARVRLTEKKRCPFLRTDGLCEIQYESEEQNLSETCRTYPRVIHCWGDQLAEWSLHISCPMAAQLVLDAKRPMVFSSRRIEMQQLRGMRFEAAGEELRFSHTVVRGMLIYLLQLQEYGIRERLLLANAFFNQSVDLAASEAADLQELTAVYRQLAEQPDKVRIYCAELAGAQELQLEMLRSLLWHRLQGTAVSTEFLQQAQRFMELWQLQWSSQAAKASSALYLEELLRYEQEADRGEQQIWENYLVNQVFRDIYLTEPMADRMRWHQVVFQFLLQRALVLTDRGFFAGSAAAQREIMQRTAKAVEHDRLYLEQAAGFLALLEQGGMQFL